MEVSTCLLSSPEREDHSLVWSLGTFPSNVAWGGPRVERPSQGRMVTYLRAWAGLWLLHPSSSVPHMSPACLCWLGLVGAEGCPPRGWLLGTSGDGVEG